MQSNPVVKPLVRIGKLSVTAYTSMSELLRDAIDDSGAVVPGAGVAINPEKVIRAETDPELVDIVAGATVRFPDGIGVVWSLRRRGFRATRLAGADFWMELIREAARRAVPVYLLGASPEVLTATVEKLHRELPALRVVGTHHGFLQGAMEPDLIAEVAALAPGIVTVAMGSPRQERLIDKLRKAHPHAFYLGVGGTYDAYVGRVRRAPRAFQRLHLEWLFRLLQQPSRIGRQSVLATYVARELAGRLRG